MTLSEKSSSFSRRLGREADGKPLLVEHSWVLSALAFVFSFTLMISIGGFWDNDINYIIALGRSILADGLPWSDPLTCNEGLNCIAQQWLFCVICALLHDCFGAWAVAGLVCAIWAAVAIVTYKLAAHEAGGTRAASVAAAVSFLFLAAFMKTNPRGLDALALLVCIWAASNWLDEKGRRWLIVPIACSVALANLHCTMWPVAVMPLLAAFFDVRAAGRRRELIATVIGAAAGSACSPYGIWSTVYVFLSMSTGLADLEIAELQAPTFSYSMPMFLPFLAAVLYILAHRCSRCGLVRPDALELLVVALAIMSFAQIRNMVLFWPACALLLSRELALSAHAYKPGLFSGPVTVAESLGRLAACGMLALCAVSVVAFAGPSAGDEAAARAEAIEALENAGVKPGAAICNSFGSGGWLELAGFKPTFDERAEMYLPQVNGGQDLAAEMARYRAHYPDDALDRVSDEKYAAAIFSVADEIYYSAALEQCGYERVLANDYFTLWIRL